MTEFIVVPGEAELSARRKRAQSLVGTSKGRPEEDWYPTPPEATEALLSVERFDGLVLEPACGDGAICRVLERRGIPYVATDLVDRGFGRGGCDFLTCDGVFGEGRRDDGKVEHIITNPPFKLAQQFIEKSLQLTTGKVAMLLKLQFLEGAKRKTMFENTPLKAVYVFSKRLTMTREGKPMEAGGMIAFAWFVWDHAHTGPATLGWL